MQANWQAGAFNTLAEPMKSSKRRSAVADEIAEKATRGEDISEHFTNKGEMKPAI
jgi:hypothetical protein